MIELRHVRKEFEDVTPLADVNVTIHSGDVISVREIKKDNATIKANVENARPVPAWLELNNETLSGKVVRLASREDVDIAIEEHLIVELYSK